jgi:hypothetical protein
MESRFHRVTPLSSLAAAPAIILKRSKDEVGLVRGNKPENGNTSDAREKRRLRGCVRQNQTDGKIPDLFETFSRRMRCIAIFAPSERAASSQCAESGWTDFHVASKLRAQAFEPALGRERKISEGDGPDLLDSLMQITTDIVEMNRAISNLGQDRDVFDCAVID